MLEENLPLAPNRSEGYPTASEALVADGYPGETVDATAESNGQAEFQQPMEVEASVERTSAEENGVHICDDSLNILPLASSDNVTPSCYIPEVVAYLANNRKLPEFTINQKIQVLDKFHAAVSSGMKHPKKYVVEWTKAEFKRPSFSRQSFNSWIENEAVIRSSEGRKQLAKKAFKNPVYASCVV